MRFPARTSGLPSLRCSQVEFASLLSYAPRGDSPTADQSRNLRTALKQGFLVGDPPTPVSTWVADYIRQRQPSLPALSSVFGSSPVLVPVPKSALHRPGSLWVPDQLSSALVAAGLGARVARLLRRTTAIAKAATSVPSERPTALTHYQTLSVQSELAPPHAIVLVDDIVTTGAALLGSANRVMEAYPGASVRGFAALRTVSSPLDFEGIVRPVSGWIRLLSSGRCLRRP